MDTFFPYKVKKSSTSRSFQSILLSFSSSSESRRNQIKLNQTSDKWLQFITAQALNAVDLLLLKQANKSLPELMKALQKENIHVVLRQNDNGIIYGITYVDHKTKCVFNGSHLGKQYSANAIQQRCSAEHSEVSKQRPFQQSSWHEIDEIISNQTTSFKVLDDLLQPEANQYANEPPEQRKFKRKRKRKQQQSHN
jgi:hypothetical protein